MGSSTAHSLDKITKLKDRSNKEGNKKKSKKQKGTEHTRIVG